MNYLPIRNAVLIAGPTASGKSGLALDVARKTGGVIVNTDSMQVYDTLRILTARPDDQALEAAPHLLYGHVPASEAYSVAAWLADVERLGASGAFAERPPIFVGGTGLYFTALTRGLSNIPPIPVEIRDAWRRRLSEERAASLHRLLAEADNAMAETLRPTDGHRIVRALEVLEATGRSLSYWQGKKSKPLVDLETAQRLMLEPDRAELTARIDARFDAMIRQGALEEAKSLRKLRLDPALPVMKAIGVRELTDFLADVCSLDEAAQHAKAATRQYARRQLTWFRNQFSDWRRAELVVVSDKDGSPAFKPLNQP